jgi:hypothetical protein
MPSSPLQKAQGTTPATRCAPEGPSPHIYESSSSAITTIRKNVEPSSRTKRKRTAISVNSLRTCLCGLQIDESEPNIIKCARAGCETQWVGRYLHYSKNQLTYPLFKFHILCAQAPTTRNWACEACMGTRQGKQARR